MDDLPPVPQFETSLAVSPQPVEAPETSAVAITPKVEPLSQNKPRGSDSNAINVEFSILDAMKQEEKDLLNTETDSAAAFFLQERVQSRKLSQFDNLATHYKGSVSSESSTKVRESLQIELQALQQLPDPDEARIAEIALVLKSIESIPRESDDPRSEDEIVAELIGKAYSAAYAVRETPAPTSTTPETSQENSSPAPESEQNSPAEQSDSTSEQPAVTEHEADDKEEEKSTQREVAEAAFNYFIANPDNSMQQFIDFFFSQTKSRGSFERPLVENEKKNEVSWSKVLGERVSEARDGLSRTLLEYLVEADLIDDFSSGLDSKSPTPYLDAILSNQDIFTQLRNTLNGKLDTHLEEILSKWLSQSGNEDLKVYGKPETNISSDQQKQLLSSGSGSQMFQALIA